MELDKKDYNLMMRVSRKYAKSQEDYQDIFQTSVLKALTATMKDITKKKSYLGMIARNTAFNFYRNRPTFVPVDEIYDLGYSIELKDKIYFEHLPKKQRECFRLRLLGHSFKEIGTMLNTTEASARTNCRLARKKLTERPIFKGFTFEIGTGVLG